MLSWAMVLHFYQPPTQKLEVTREILESCYLPLVDLLEKKPQIKVTLNLSGSMLEQIERVGDQMFFNKINVLVKRGQIELLNSPSFHPLIPLTDSSSIDRQFERNSLILGRLFPEAKLSGIYPPELAVSAESLALLKKYGQFVLVDQTSVGNWDLWGKPPTTSVFQWQDMTLVANTRLVTEIIRSFPGIMQGTKFASFLKSKLSKGSLVTINDAELFGHHYQERLSFLQDIFKDADFKFVTLSALISKQEAPSLTRMQTATWNTTEEEYRQGNFFPLWLNSINKLQQMYFDLSSYVKSVVNAAPVVPDSIFQKYALEHYDKGTSSCNLYWLSNWPWWHPDLVQEGAAELVKAIRTLPVHKVHKLESEKKYHEFVHHLWQWHWSGEVEKNWARYNDYRQEFLKKIPQFTSN